MGKGKLGSKTPMTKDAARRIQSHADKTGTNKDFARRAQSAADRGSKKK
ncbi:MAG: hypothetical protein ACTSYL_03005 [Candidatus Thorarchaeota archaeon]